MLAIPLSGQGQIWMMKDVICFQTLKPVIFITPGLKIGGQVP